MGALIIFFRSSSPSPTPYLGFALGATRNMGYAQGRTFRTSPNERLHRRTDGPALTLIAGTAGGPRTSIRDAWPTHPGQEGFTPDGLPSDCRVCAVHSSEPRSSPFATRPRGNTTHDTERLTSTG